MMNKVSPGLLSLLRLASPSLPVGAFAYSQGLECVIDRGELTQRDEVLSWLTGVLRNSHAYLDAPMCLRMHRAWAVGDELAVKRLSAELIAWRDAKELRLEDRQQGQALARLLTDLGEARAAAWLRQPYTSYIAMYSLAAVAQQVNENEALAGLLWSWCENQVAAAIKLVPLGQTDGQRILMKLQPVIEEVIANALQVDDADVGASLPGVAMVSAWHEQQYSRLFRS